MAQRLICASRTRRTDSISTSARSAPSRRCAWRSLTGGLDTPRFASARRRSCWPTSFRRSASFRSPRTLGGTPVNILVYVNDVDAFVRRAEQAGAKVTRAPADQFYGDRMASIEDPFDHSWSFATHVEDVPAEKMEKRAASTHAK